MSATVYHLPGAEPPPLDHPGLNLSPAEVQDAAEGYVRPADQLRVLHAKGFVRASRSKISGKVVLERAHYDAVVRGQFGHQVPANDSGAPRAPLPPNRAGYKSKFGRGAKGA